LHQVRSVVGKTLSCSHQASLQVQKLAAHSYYTVPIPQSSATSKLADLLPGVFSSQIEEFAGYLDCSSCPPGRKTVDERNYIVHAPQALIFQLERFEFQYKADVQAYTQRKNLSPVLVPYELNMQEHCKDVRVHTGTATLQDTEPGKLHLYRLCAVVIHIGTSLSAGHFVTVADFNWQSDTGATVFNDSRVSRCRLSELGTDGLAGVISHIGGQAYIAVYERAAESAA
jgi:ubiquitin C-terminal hydrolase